MRLGVSAYSFKQAIAKGEIQFMDIFAKAKEIVALIHNLVGGIMGALDKECALCGEIH